MSTAELVEDRELTLQLHHMLSDIDPARWRDEMAQALRERLEALSRQMANRRRLAELSQALATEVPTLPTTASDTKSRWLAFKRRIQPAYAHVAEQLRAEEVHVPSLRPTNHARSLMHLAAALVALLAVEFMPHGVLVGLAILWAGFAWSCEVARRVSPAVNRRLMWFFGPVAHEHESRRVNSATWYATALLALAVVARPEACAVAVMVLGVGDPVAALIGRRFGRVRLMHGRSLEGSVAFLVSGALAALVVLRIFHGAMGGWAALSVAAAGALLGAIAELVSLRVDDNLSIPLSAALGASTVLWLVA